MRFRTIALAIPVIGFAACKTSSSESAQAQTPSTIGSDAALLNPPKQGPPPVAATEREGDATGATASSDLKAHSDDRVITGKISGVSGQSLTITSDDGNDRTLLLVPQTSVQVNGQEAQTTDLQEGQPVRASFNTVGSEDVAVDVRAGSATGPSPSGSTGSPGTPGAEPMPEGGRGSPQSSDQPDPGKEPTPR